MDGLTEGRIVHFVMPDGQHRPAVVVRVWSQYKPGYVNLQVLTDGTNDATPANVAAIGTGIASGLVWRTSIDFDDAEKKPNTWHWIERA